LASAEKAGCGKDSQTDERCLSAMIDPRIGEVDVQNSNLSDVTFIDLTTLRLPRLRV
jgi:hypothetical protein